MRYRVQDLANHNRNVNFPDGTIIHFDGHYAIVDEAYIDFFRNKSDFQVSEETGTPIPQGVTTQSLVKEPIKEAPKSKKKGKK